MLFACHNSVHHAPHSGKEQVTGIFDSWSPYEEVCFITLATLAFPQILLDEFPTGILLLIMLLHLNVFCRLNVFFAPSPNSATFPDVLVLLQNHHLFLLSVVK